MKKSTVVLLFVLLAVTFSNRGGVSQPHAMRYTTQFAQERREHQQRTEPTPHNPVITAAHKATHIIEQSTIVGGGHCSATSIGPHAILTASHCEAATDDINIDGDNYKVLGLSRDKYDHSILYVDATFTSWATLAAEPAQVGDDVFVFGNPGEYEDVLRKGYVAAVPNHKSEPILFDFNGWPGDSGSGIFNVKGELVDVTSIGALQSRKGESAWPAFKLMGGFAIQFTPEDFKAAVAFQPPAGRAKPPVDGQGTTDDDIQELLRRYFRH